MSAHAKNILHLVNPDTYRAMPSFSNIPVLTDEESERLAKMSLKDLLSFADESGFNSGATREGRTLASQMLIESIKPQSVIEIGIGQGATTFRELTASGALNNYQVSGIDINPSYGKDLSEVIYGDILNPNALMRDTISRADIIRSANTVLPYFTDFHQYDDPSYKSKKLGRFFGIMEKTMKDGAMLLLTYSYNVRLPGEEGYLYQKVDGKLSLADFVYSLWEYQDILMYTCFSYSYPLSIMGDHIRQKLITGPIAKSGYIKECSHGDAVPLPAMKNMEAIVKDLSRSEPRVKLRGAMISVPIDYIYNLAVTK